MLNENILLNGIKNFLTFINDNWTTIIVIVSLIATLVKKIQSYLLKSDSEKIEIAKAQIKQAMLKLISDAEVDYENWNQAGSVKRSQVIQKIYKEYPAMSKIADQSAVVSWIDETINESLKELRKIVAQNKTE